MAIIHMTEVRAFSTACRIAVPRRALALARLGFAGTMPRANLVSLATSRAAAVCARWPVISVEALTLLVANARAMATTVPLALEMNIAGFSSEAFLAFAIARASIARPIPTALLFSSTTRARFHVTYASLKAFQAIACLRDTRAMPRASLLLIGRPAYRAPHIRGTVGVIPAFFAVARHLSLHGRICLNGCGRSSGADTLRRGRAVGGAFHLELSIASLAIVPRIAGAVAIHFVAEPSS